MKNRDIIEDSLDFCKDIQYYETDDKGLLFDSKNFPNLKEYINWVDSTDSSVSKDFKDFEDVLDLTDRYPLEKLEDTKVPQSTKKAVLSFLLEMVVCVAISIGIVFLISNFVITHTRVVGHSMEDTLHDGEYLLINRLTYQFNDPEQFDVVVFQHDDDEKYIKRIIACPNQTIQIMDGTIYVDGNVVNENYGNSTIMDPGIAKNPITLGDDEYFVLGDNRNHSSDSRSSSVGLIKRDKIQGKVLLRFYPFSEFGTVE